jgi:hypothetical protein
MNYIDFVAYIEANYHTVTAYQNEVLQHHLMDIGNLIVSQSRIRSIQHWNTIVTILLYCSTANVAAESHHDVICLGTVVIPYFLSQYGSGLLFRDNPLIHDNYVYENALSIVTPGHLSELMHGVRQIRRQFEYQITHQKSCITEVYSLMFLHASLLALDALQQYHQYMPTIVNSFLLFQLIQLGHTFAQHISEMSDELCWAYV